MDAIAGPVQQDDVDKLKAEVRRLRRLLREAETEVTRLKPLVDLDTLVPLFNRRAFSRELERVAAYCKRYQTTAVLLYLDLDGFKSVNDSFGHAAGDAVLKNVADLLIQGTRRSDVLGRLGGDEFGILLVRTNAANGQLVAERLKAKIAETAVAFDGQMIPVTASTGLAFVDGMDGESKLLELADEAMYRSKQTVSKPLSRQ